MSAHTWSPLIVSHTGAALVALTVGGVVFWRPKGTTLHRVLGRVWVALMVVVSGTSFGIYRETYSWIHALSVFTLLMLALAILQARRGDIRQHRRTMTGVYVGALLIAGLFTLLPGRLIGQAFWGAL